ncbi:MAG: Arylsulfatase [Porticoccaceae bacterium UBA1117]|nr:sulfatase-like hydrolase/transferase [Porticoccaceae bacterium]CAI8278456.1 MAG: Arylsulfatase [Porticoccaceae bacterium UBA1117]
MKKLLIATVIIAIAASTAWQNRVNLIVWAVPIAINFKNVPPNAPIEWSQGPTTAELTPNERPPNIIFIMADDMGFNDVSLYNGGAGDGSVMTPNIDALAQQGVRFNNGYAANSVCAPSRATALTGRYSTRFGFEYTPIFKLGPLIFNWMQQTNPAPLPNFIDTDIADILPSFEYLGMETEQITIAETLKEQGYYTAHIGKWHLGSVGDMRPQAQGFDDSLELAGSLYLPEDNPDVVNYKVLDEGIEKMVWATAQYRARFNGNEFQPDGYLTDYYTREAVKVIEANKNRPFFLYLAHWGIHNPIQATKADYDSLSHIKDHGLRVYSAMIKSLDRSVGTIVETLEANGLSDNTLIVFTSDNGGAGYIRLADINKPYRGWKLNHFEGGTHVPYMAKWPAKIKAGTVYQKPIHHIDLFNTFANAGGAQIPSDRKMDGVDLLPYITGKNQNPPHDTLFWRQGTHQTVLHKGWKLIRSEDAKNGPDAPQLKWLFNLETDPTEQNNLAEVNVAKVAELDALLATHNAEQAPPAWPSAVNAAQRIDKHGGEPYAETDEYVYFPN